MRPTSRSWEISWSRSSALRGSKTSTCTSGSCTLLTKLSSAALSQRYRLFLKVLLSCPFCYKIAVCHKLMVITYLFLDLTNEYMSYPEGGAALERVLRLLKLVKVEDFKVGFERLRQAKLDQAHEDVYPYKYSAFETRRMQPDGVLPSSYYVLTARLSFQEALRVRLNEIGIDLFNLPGIVYFEVGDKLRGLVPPIIEVYPEPEFSGQTVASLQDGLH